jgi:hypothetical protein
VSHKKAIVMTHNYTSLDNRELIGVFDFNNDSVALDIIENKYDQCNRVHMTRGETRELYLKLKDIFN